MFCSMGPNVVVSKVVQTGAAGIAKCSPHHRAGRLPAVNGWLGNGAKRELSGVMERSKVVHSAGGVRAMASVSSIPAMSDWLQKAVTIPQQKRGCHVITRKILAEVPEISKFEVGLANFFIMHTSASLTINENASSDVPLDLNDSLDRIVPEGNMYRHLDEGYDDMPAHVKSSLMGPSLTIPINKGRLALGTWQGIYLNEHRNYGGSRTIIVTLQGRKME